VLDTASQQTRGGAQMADFGCQHVHQLGLSVRTAIGQGPLKMIPDAFVRIEFRGVRREGHHVQPRGTGE